MRWVGRGHRERQTGPDDAAVRWALDHLRRDIRVLGTFEDVADQDMSVQLGYVRLDLIGVADRLERLLDAADLDAGTRSKGKMT